MTIGSNNIGTTLFVTGGTLRVDAGSTVNGTGGIQVSGTGVVSGGGSIGTTVIVGAYPSLTTATGGTVAPADAANTTFANGLALGDTSTLSYFLHTPGLANAGPANGNDLITSSLAGGLLLSPNAFVAGMPLGTATQGTVINIQSAAFGGAGLYDLLNYNGAFSGNFNSLGIGTAPAGFLYQLINNTGGSQIDLQVTAVPEPSGVILGTLALAGLVWSGSRKRRRATTVLDNRLGGQRR